MIIYFIEYGCIRLGAGLATISLKGAVAQVGIAIKNLVTTPFLRWRKKSLNQCVPDSTSQNKMLFIKLNLKKW